MELDSLDDRGMEFLIWLYSSSWYYHHSLSILLHFDCVNSSILWDIFCHFFWAAIIFFSLTH